jgi:predicted O-methyltransferase YrrM
MAKRLKNLARKNPFLWVLYNLPRLAKGYQPVFLDYPVEGRPRYGYGRPPHAELKAILGENRESYRETLQSFLRFKEALLRIPLRSGKNSTEPCWINRWLPGGLDTLALYGMLATRRPRRYVEVGSGYSTRVARRAIREEKLNTKIISIDPRPRAKVEELCDEVIRKPLQEVEVPELAGSLEPGDIIFLDGSHRASMNSDVSVFFLEVLPRLRPGVLAHLHDIALPNDYPPEWQDWHYSEQYLLAASLLAGHANYQVVLPNAFVSLDKELSETVEPLWREPQMHPVPREGLSFWMRVR